MGANEAFLLKKVVFGDIVSSRLSNGDGIIQVGGTFQTLLQTFIIFQFGQQGCQ